jgi:hypothetical protein
MGEETVSCLRYVSSIAGENTQISHLAWSTWTTERAGLCMSLTLHVVHAKVLKIGHAWLACGCSDGSVRLVRITQSLDISQTSEGTSAPSTDHEQDWSSIPLCEADGYGITAMRCVDTISGGVSGLPAKLPAAGPHDYLAMFRNRQGWQSPDRQLEFVRRVLEQCAHPGSRRPRSHGRFVCLLPGVWHRVYRAQRRPRCLALRRILSRHRQSISEPTTDCLKYVREPDNRRTFAAGTDSFY